MLEPSRTNLITYSQDFSQGYTLSNTSIISNDVISPEGVQNATKIYPLSSGNYRHIRYSPLSPSSGLHTFSVFAKAGELEHLVLLDYDGGGVGIDFNLSNGVATDNAPTPFDSFDMVDYGNGWYRCIATATNPYFYWILSDNGNISVTVNGNDGLYIWGFQAEQGSYPTSLIKTEGTAQTRLLDNSFQLIPTDISLSTSGTIFLDYTLNIKLTAGHFPLSILDYNNGSGNEWLTRGSFRFDIRPNGNATYEFVLLSSAISSSTQVSNVFPNIGSRGKMAVSWDGTNVTFSVNGINYQDTINTNFTGSLDGVFLGVLKTFNNTHKGGQFNDVKLYNTALSDSELIALTQV